MKSQENTFRNHTLKKISHQNRPRNRREDEEVKKDFKTSVKNRFNNLKENMDTMRRQTETIKMK